MSIQIYHPNKNNTGFACSFSQSSKDNAIFATLIKQSTWDQKNQIGTFSASRNDPLKQVNVKLAQVEAAAILDALDRGREFSTVHDGDKQLKAIRFNQWMNKVSEGEKPSQRGYSFSIAVTDKEDSSAKNSFYIGLTFPEGRLIREFLIHALNKSFQKQENLPEKKSF